MTTSAEEILRLYNQLRQERGPEISRMEKMQRQYNCDVAVPLPELDEAEKPAVANLAAQGIDQLAMRLGSVMPDCACPPVSESDQARRRARDRRRAVLGWWDMNRLQTKLRRRGRFYFAYGCAPAIVKPVGSERKMPHWRMLNPLATFPAPTSDPDCIEPEYAIHLSQQSLRWLTAKYPVEMSVLRKGSDRTPNKMFELLEYNDPEETVLVVVGSPEDPYTFPRSGDGGAVVMELERAPNRAEICLVVNPGRITLDRLQGHFDALLGMFMAQAKMTALEQIAVFRSIFPEEWIVSHPNAPGRPRVIREADGKEGIVGIIENGTLVPIITQPSPQVPTTIDRLERAQRIQGGIPSDWGGESATNIRTARRGEQVLSSTSDPTLAEAQDVMAAALEAESVRAVKIMKAYYGSKPTSFYIPSSGQIVSEDYTPNKAFETDWLVVKYSMPGMDAAAIPIELGQRVQMGEISMHTARVQDPAVEDAEYEESQTLAEGLRRALLSSIETQTQQGSYQPIQIAQLIKATADGNTMIEDAVETVHEQMQQQQAAQAQMEQGSPGMQPGLSPQPPGAAPQSPPGVPPLAQLLQSLRQPPNQSPAERALAPQQGAMSAAG